MGRITIHSTNFFLSVEYKLYEIIAEHFDCTIYCADTFWCGPDMHVDDCPAFFEMINEEYNTYFGPDPKDFTCVKKILVRLWNWN